MFNKNFKVAIVGATGNVGRIIITQLLEKKIVASNNLVLLASPNSAGQKLIICDHEFEIIDTNLNNLQACNLCIFATNSEISEKYIPKLLESISVPYIIDSSSCYRLDTDVPLVILMLTVI